MAVFHARAYKIGLDRGGLLLFLAVMAPNFIWSAVPAPHDILRSVSVTPAVDAATAVFQVIMVAAICGLKNVKGSKPIRRALLVGVAALVALYYGGWSLYYTGTTGTAVILDLCVAPSLAFLLYAAARKNAPALIAAGFFAACHLLSSAVNFIF